MFELGRLYLVNNAGTTLPELGNNITRISRVHCRFVWDAEGFVLEDVGANGTWVNGKKIGKGKRTSLAAGDRIVLLFDSEEKAPLLEYEFIPLYEQGGEEVEMERQRTAATQLIESDENGGDKDSIPVGRKREREGEGKEENEEESEGEDDDEEEEGEGNEEESGEGQDDVEEQVEVEEEEEASEEQLRIQGNAKRHKPWLETNTGRAAQVGVLAVGAFMVLGMLGTQYMV
jgi:hypothetical protein